MQRPKIYITSRSFGQRCEEAIKLLESFADVERKQYGRALNEQELLQIVRDADALIVGHDKIDGKIIEHSEKLKIIARHGIGVDNIDLQAATDRNVVVTYAPHANADTVADFTMGLVLSLARQIPQAYMSMSQGKWESAKFIGIELCGKILGIVGLGDIGYRVAKRAKGFDMKIFYWSRRRKTDIEKELGIQYVELETLLRESDFITLHVALTNETRGLIGEKEFSLMKRTAYLINTARGPVVDEKALYNALRNGQISGAAIDVYSKEPPDFEDPMLKFENVVKTPHIAAYTVEAVRRMDLMNAQDLFKFFKGEKPIYVANPEVLGKISL
ncbi:MAG: phosphoglycerate dehydrogenase [Candidatus Bathyarchaeia archaeon]